MCLSICAVTALLAHRSLAPGPRSSCSFLLASRRLARHRLGPAVGRLLLRERWRASTLVVLGCVYQLAASGLDHMSCGYRDNRTASCGVYAEADDGTGPAIRAVQRHRPTPEAQHSSRTPPDFGSIPMHGARQDDGSNTTGAAATHSPLVCPTQRICGMRCRREACGWRHNATRSMMASPWPINVRSTMLPG